MTLYLTPVFFRFILQLLVPKSWNLSSGTLQLLV